MMMAATAGPSTPMEVQEVSFRTPDGIERLLIDLESHQLPNLAEAAQAGKLDAAEAEVHQTLRRLQSLLGIWSVDAQDLGRNQRERMGWQQSVQAAQQRLADLRTRTSKALLEARKQQQRTHAQTAQQARQALLGDLSSSQAERTKRRNERLQNQTADEQLMTASGDVTAALQRAVQSMSVELEKSSYSAQLLDESSVSIQQATLQYTSFTELVASSQKLLRSMERADMWDAAMLLLSFLFFVGCILYILKVRIWDRGIGLFTFLFRMVGLTSSRSPADVQEKLKLAREAVISSSRSLAAKASSSAMSASLAASASLAMASLAAQQAAEQSASLAAQQAEESASLAAAQAMAESASSVADQQATLSTAAQVTEVVTDVLPDSLQATEDPHTSTDESNAEEEVMASSPQPASVDSESSEPVQMDASEGAATPTVIVTSEQSEETTTLTPADDVHLIEADPEDGTEVKEVVVELEEEFDDDSNDASPSDDDADEVPEAEVTHRAHDEL